MALLLLDVNGCVASLSGVQPPTFLLQHGVLFTFAAMKVPAIIGLFAATVLMLNAADGFSQCRKHAKKTCGSVMEGYTMDGTMEGEQLFEGEWRTYNRMFYSGVDYRLAVCVDEKVREGAYFEVLDGDGAVFYTNKGTSEWHWDFDVSSGISMDVVVYMPKKPEDRYFRNAGCSTVMIGFMP